MRIKSRQAVAAATELTDHGRHIFIYNNLLTNQVVYSLKQSMRNNHVLKQLAYFGKKSVPAKLRKDVWAPLASVTFPYSSQGLDAFHKLREYRKLRDVTWDRDAEGMPLEKKRRKRALMDQKANSIADLAAILHRQADFGRETEAEAQQVKQEQEAKASEEQKRVESELKELAKRAKSGETTEIEAKIEDLTLRMLGKKFPNRPAPGEKRKESMARRILELRQLKNRLKKAEEAVQNGTVSELARKRVVRQIVDRALHGSAPKDVLNEQDIIKRSWPPPRFGRRRILSLPKKIDFFTAEGVTISWSNVMDTEFAESWPKAVRHTHMGITRHTAANPDVPPQMEHRIMRGSPVEEAQRQMEEEAELQAKAQERERRQEESESQRRKQEEGKTSTWRSLREKLPF